MFNKITAPVWLVAGLTLVGSPNLFSQCTDSCPLGATEGPASVLGLSAFLIGPDGTTGSAIGTNQVSACSTIRLGMTLSYSPFGASGGTTVAFSGGSMVLKTPSGHFSQDITPKAGVPMIGPPGSACNPATNFFVVLYDFDIS